MTTELVPLPPARLARLWDQDYNLVYTFSPDEDLTDLPLQHPVTKIVYAAAEKRQRLNATIDENGTRWSGTLGSSEVHRLYPGGPKRLLLTFMDHYTPIQKYIQ